MLQKILFVIALRRKKFLHFYNLLKSNEFESFEKIKEYQEEKLKKIISFSYNNVPYYHRVFKQLNLTPKDISSIEDLQKLPILNKEIIKGRQQEFIPINLKDQKFVNQSTGGSTGTPFQYRLSKEDEVLSTALLYANMGYAGYKLGDKMAVLAGSSLIPLSSKSKFRKDIRSFMMHTKFYSSFGLDNEYMRTILMELNKFKPKYIRGYASSIFLFAKFIKDNNFQIDFQPKGIFTTAEVLFDFNRKIIENTFGCKVFNQYGVNDGGVSAYECKIHNGLHIDMLRSIMEVVDEEGNQLDAGTEGKILATSLFNYSMPFLRYDTGDMGIVSDKKCRCGRELQLLEKIIGRTTDYLKFSNGRIIGAPILTVLFGKYDIIQYQIIQKEGNKILINIIKGEKYSDDDEKKIRDIFYKHVGKIDMNFKYVDKIETTTAGKWKFIIRENDG